MAVRTDCRHYSTRSTPTGEVVQRCRMDMASAMPFDCPDDCIFFEPRHISSAGWQQDIVADDGDDRGDPLY